MVLCFQTRLRTVNLSRGIKNSTPAHKEETEYLYELSVNFAEMISDFILSAVMIIGSVN
jgi:hypothetical protein